MKYVYRLNPITHYVKKRTTAIQSYVESKNVGSKMWKKIIHVIITAGSRMNKFASWEDKWEELAHIGTIKIAKKYNKRI